MTRRRRKRKARADRPRWLVVLLIWFHETMADLGVREAEAKAWGHRKRYGAAPPCPGPDCLMCSGEACALCGAGCWSRQTDCEHDCLERHQQPTWSDESTASPAAALDHAARARP